jgi:hypothetical protein
MWTSPNAHYVIGLARRPPGSSPASARRAC